MLLKNIKGLNGILLGLQHSHHIDVGEQVRGDCVGQYSYNPMQPRKRHDYAQYDSNNLLEDKQNINDFLFSNLALG